ncbi:MAG TPA: hypothetical protein VN372_01395 [Methanospirillum sp.]|nr:hypothetical protein [Methanospirillum sp.]
MIGSFSENLFYAHILISEQELHIRMQLAELFEADQISLVEPLFSDLCYVEMDELILNIPSDKVRILIDEGDDVLSFAVDAPDGTVKAACCHLRSPSDELFNRFNDIDGDVYQVPRIEFEDAVRRYYCERLPALSLPAGEDLNPDRFAITLDLVKSIVGDEKDVSCLDCCCGSGIGTHALRALGLNPLSYDNDDALLARGLKEGRLLPDRTMWIDGRNIEHYLTEPVDCAFGFMLGEFQQFNEDDWNNIVGGFCSVADQALMTVGTEREMDIISAWLTGAGMDHEIWENERDPIYDRWVCLAECG